MKEILLTQGKTTIIDDDDYERLNRFKWHTHEQVKKWYANRKLRKNEKYKYKSSHMPMHREILNAPSDKHVDHINGDTLDNRKINLRLCTNQQNCSNKKNARSDNKLGIKGVSWHKASEKFIAQIQFSGKKIHLGCFNVMGDADSAYRFAEEKYFSEFARNNK